MASVRRVLENRAENPSVFVLKQVPSAHTRNAKDRITATGTGNELHGAPLTVNTLNEISSTEKPLLFVRRQTRTPPMRRGLSSAERSGSLFPVTDQHSSEGLSASNAPLGNDDRSVTASGVTSAGVTRSRTPPSDEGLLVDGIVASLARGLTPLRTSRYNMPSGASAAGQLQLESSSTQCNAGSVKPFAIPTRLKTPPLANVTEETTVAAVATSRVTPRKSGITPRKSNSTPRKSGSVTPTRLQTPPLANVAEETTITAVAASQATPRKSDSTPRKSGNAVKQSNSKFKLSLDFSNINQKPVDSAAGSSETDGTAATKFGLSRTGTTFTTDKGMVISERGIAKDPPRSARVPKTSRPTKPKKMKAEFILLKELGRGAGGVVFKAIHVLTLNIVAIKKVRMATQAKKKQVMREVQALFANLIPLSDKRKGSPCRNIVTFHGAFTNPATLHMSIVLEFMDWGVLQQLVRNGTPCTEAQLAYIGASILKGLNFIHTCHQVHRDIKPDNVLINSRGEIKISDFGIARDMNPMDSKDMAETFTGTVMYMSPERLAGKYYSYSSDIWSFGLSMTTLALGKFPFDSKKGFWGIIGVLNDNPVPKLSDDMFSAEACDFVSQCLRKESSQRMSAKELLGHSFLRQSCGPAKFVKLFPPISEAEKLKNLRKIVGQLAQHYKRKKRRKRRAVSAPVKSMSRRPPDSGEEAPTDRCFANLAKQIGVSSRKVKQYFQQRMNSSNKTKKTNVRLPKIHIS